MKKERNLKQKILTGFIFMLVVFGVASNLLISKANTPSKIWIDFPKQESTQKQEILIQGWFLSTQKDKILEIYLDAENITDQIQFMKRDDVLKAIQGYGTKQENPLPGFYVKMNTQNYQDGKHVVTIKMIQKDTKQELAKETRSFVIKKQETLLQVDFPKQNEKIKTSMNIQGWVMTEAKNAKVEVDFNGKTYTPTRQARPDVLKAIHDYGGKTTNLTPGYQITIDTKDLVDKSYPVTIKVISQIGEVIEKQTKTISLKKYDTLLQVDFPKQNEKIKTSMNIQGWVMTEAKNAKVEIEFNGKTYSTTRQTRNDVLNAIDGYGNKTTNPTPGYQVNIESKDLDYKTYDVIIQVKSSTGEILEKQSRKITIRPYETLLQVDFPKQNEMVKTSMNIQGWIMTEAKNAKVEIEFNGKTYSTTRQTRNDVLNAITGYGGKTTNLTPGYQLTIDMKDLKDQKYTVAIRVLSENGKILEEQTKNIVLKKYDACITVDFPKEGETSQKSLFIQGWNLSEQADRRIEVYLNDQKLTTGLSTYARQDAVDAMKGKGFGDSSTNQNAGFTTTIDVSGYEKGDYTLKVKVFSNVTNELLGEKSVGIGIKKISFERGTYGYSGLKVAGDSRGNDLKYYKVGNGPNVFFAIFTIHGFEDHFGRDGTEISVIAEQFVNRLLTMQDIDLANQWTIYIFPEVNPDGRNYGWTNNGPGRTTLFSASSNRKGIDLNRCWSTNFTPMYNDRNYTGSEPFLAYESRYLRDFLLSKKATNGQTVLVDLHGWTTQLIGDQGICQYYGQKFPQNPYTSSYGKGYLINWARSSLGSNGKTARAALIELPEYGSNGKRISNHEDVVNSQYAEKYIEATIAMLRGIL